MCANLCVRVVLPVLCHARERGACETRIGDGERQRPDTIVGRGTERCARNRMAIASGACRRLRGSRAKEARCDGVMRLEKKRERHRQSRASGDRRTVRAVRAETREITDRSTDHSVHQAATRRVREITDGF